MINVNLEFTFLLSETRGSMGLRSIEHASILRLILIPLILEQRNCWREKLVD